MEAELSSEVGPAGRLFKANVDLFWALLQRSSVLKIEDSQKEALKDTLSGFYFWGEGYHPYDGRLDAILSNSRRLRDRVLSVLTEIGEILCDEKTGLFALFADKLEDAKLNQQRIDVQDLIDIIRDTLDESNGSDSSLSSNSSEGDDILNEVINKLRALNRCLVDLSTSLERPAPNAVEEETPAIQRFQLSSPAEFWTGKVLDTYPKIDLTLAKRLGEANWLRYQRISHKVDHIEDFEYDSDGGPDNVGALPIFTKNTKSTRDQSTVLSNSAGALDQRSQATYTPVVTDDQGERGWLRIPSLPIKEEDLGKAFRCTICGDKLQEIMSRTDWKRHVFADLEPYICTFSECTNGIASFPTWTAWADHEFLVHRIGKNWHCVDCAQPFEDSSLFREHLRRKHKYNLLTKDQLNTMIKAAERPKTASNKVLPCPFCSEPPRPTSRAFARHVAQHLEEIALAVLPRDSDADMGHCSISSKPGLPAILDDMDLGDPDISDKQEASIIEPAKGDTASSTEMRRIGLKDMNVMAMLGKGTSGKVALIEMKESKRLYACKIIKKELIIGNDDIQSLRTEKKVLLMGKADKHPFICQLVATFQTENRLYFVTEYVPGGDLMFHIQRGHFSIILTRFVASEICLALKYLHEKGVIHRNLKLENILLAQDGHVKITDFGNSKTDMWYGSTTSTFCGNSEFMAPEMLADKNHGRAVDWWAFGVLVYEMLLHEAPFHGDDQDELYDAILDADPIYPIQTPQVSISFLRGLLNREPEKRLGGGPTDAEEVMSHDWFSGVDWLAVYEKRVPPPFVPVLSNETDISNFDDECTSESPVLTPVQGVLTKAMQDEFRGFSYVADDI